MNLKRYDADEPSSSASSSPEPKRRRCSSWDESQSESDSTSGSDDSTESRTLHEVDQKPENRSELLLTQLSMFPGEETWESMAASNGKDPSRVKGVLNKNLCACKQRCYRLVTFNMVLQLCQSFWALNKSAQDCVLWGIQNMASKTGLVDEPSSSGSGSDSESSSTSDIPVKNSWYIQGLD